MEISTSLSLTNQNSRPGKSESGINHTSIKGDRLWFGECD